MEKRSPEIFFATLTGIIMMIFMLASLTDLTLFDFRLELFGFSIGMGLNAMELLIPLAAVLTDLGMYYALKTYLPVDNEQILNHLFLPFSVTLTIGFTLRNIRGGLTGWALLFVTGLLLYLVLHFEYVACDPASVQRPVAIMVLDGLCYAVFLLFIIALRAYVPRLIVEVPSMFILCFVVSLKIYSFYVIRWDLFQIAGLTALVMCFANAGLHYWPVNIVTYGAMMFLWYYTFTNLVIGADRDEAASGIMRRILPADIPAVVVMVFAMIRL